jgi:hypothetical protein
MLWKGLSGGANPWDDTDRCPALLPLNPSDTMPPKNLIARRTAVVLTCCHCHSVRDAGGAWSQSPPPSGARLSHGICPVCLGRHYPGVRPPQPAPATR